MTDKLVQDIENNPLPEGFCNGEGFTIYKVPSVARYVVMFKASNWEAHFCSDEHLASSFQSGTSGVLHKLKARTRVITSEEGEEGQIHEYTSARAAVESSASYFHPFDLEAFSRGVLSFSGLLDEGTMVNEKV
jgi:hypothetical protein